MIDTFKCRIKYSHPVQVFMSALETKTTIRGMNTMCNLSLWEIYLKFGEIISKMRQTPPRLLFLQGIMPTSMCPQGLAQTSHSGC